MTNNNNQTATVAPILSLIERIYGVEGAKVAYKVKDVLGLPIEIRSFRAIPTPQHIRDGMEASDQETPEMIGVIEAQVDGVSAVIVSLSQALNDQMTGIAAYCPFVAPIELKSAKTGRTYPQVSL